MPVENRSSTSAALSGANAAAKAATTRLTRSMRVSRLYGPTRTGGRASILPFTPSGEAQPTLNGQIQYGSASRLTSERTRPVALLVGCSLLLGGLLVAAPREVPEIATAVVLGGAWLSLVLAMTLPRSSDPAGSDLIRRLAQFRHELNAVGDSPSRAALDRMVARAQELDLNGHEVAEELEQLGACIEALDLKARISRGDLPSAAAPDPVAPGDACYFASAVRFGRRRSDQFGHLVLYRTCLKFRGALDVSVAWSEIASVARDRRDIVVALQDSHRVLRFACHSAKEAATGGVLAEHLAQAARRGRAPGPSEYHAST